MPSWPLLWLCPGGVLWGGWGEKEIWSPLSSKDNLRGVALSQTTQGQRETGGAVRTHILLPITQVQIWSPPFEGSGAQAWPKTQ